MLDLESILVLLRYCRESFYDMHHVYVDYCVIKIKLIEKNGCLMWEKSSTIGIYATDDDAVQAARILEKEQDLKFLGSFNKVPDFHPDQLK